jgi:uncharacterized protein YbjT (DUF2867 family)
MTVLVTGGRGSIARGVVEGLVAAGMPVRLAGRDPSKLTPPEGVEVVELDLAGGATLAPALAGIDRVLLYAEPAGVEAFVAAATEAGVEQVVVVSSGSAGGGEDNPIAAKHLSVERAVGAGGFASTMLRPHNFAGNARQWLGTILADDVVKLPYAQLRDVPIDERDIADVAVAALLAGPGGHDGVLPLTGPERLSRREEVEILAKALGHEPRIDELDAEQARAFMHATVPAFVADSLLFYWENAPTEHPLHADVVERVSGHPARTFATWASEVAAPLASR